MRSDRRWLAFAWRRSPSGRRRGSKENPRLNRREPLIGPTACLSGPRCPSLNGTSARRDVRRHVSHSRAIDGIGPSRGRPSAGAASPCAGALVFRVVSDSARGRGRGTGEALVMGRRAAAIAGGVIFGFSLAAALTTVVSASSDGGLALGGMGAGFGLGTMVAAALRPTGTGLVATCTKPPGRVVCRVRRARLVLGRVRRAGGGAAAVGRRLRGC